MQVWQRSDIGRMRELNQDDYYSTTSPIGALQNLYVVADGMGGCQSGDFASHFATDYVVGAIREDEINVKPEDILYNAIIGADRALYARTSQEEDLRGAGTTLVVATIMGDQLIVANVGDSRLYLYTDQLYQVTQDHSRVMEMVRSGEISLEEAREHIDRNTITRAIGYHGLPDFFRVTVQPGMRILLCTDGLTNMVSDAELAQHLQSETDGGVLCDKLIDRANENGGDDNITVMLIEINEEVNLC